jgi:hypothetical protein
MECLLAKTDIMQYKTDSSQQEMKAYVGSLAS